MPDASALLVALFGEAGTERVETILPQAVIGAVNLSEVIAKLQERGVPDQDISRDLKDLDLRVVSFDYEQAERAGRLRNATREIGLSLGGQVLSCPCCPARCDRHHCGPRVGIALARHFRGSGALAGC